MKAHQRRDLQRRITMRRCLALEAQKKKYGHIDKQSKRDIKMPPPPPPPPSPARHAGRIAPPSPLSLPDDSVSFRYQCESIPVVPFTKVCMLPEFDVNMAICESAVPTRTLCVYMFHEMSTFESTTTICNRLVDPLMMDALPSELALVRNDLLLARYTEAEHATLARKQLTTLCHVTNVVEDSWIEFVRMAKSLTRKGITIPTVPVRFLPAHVVRIDPGVSHRVKDLASRMFVYCKNKVK
jgi:hypothetical protein